MLIIPDLLIFPNQPGDRGEYGQHEPISSTWFNTVKTSDFAPAETRF
jgi:hypothetical protein